MSKNEQIQPKILDDDDLEQLQCEVFGKCYLVLLIIRYNQRYQRPWKTI